MPINFSLLSANDIQEAAECITKTFTEDNHSIKAMNITPEEFMVFALHACQEAAKTKLSLIARDQATNKFVGCRIVEDSNNNIPVPPLSKKFDPIFAIIQAAKQHLPKLDSSNKIAHFVALSVNKEYQSLGIAKQLLALELHYLSQLNYHYFQVELGHLHAQKAIKNILQNELEYAYALQWKDFNFEGRFPFQQLTGELIVCINRTNTLNNKYHNWAEHIWGQTSSIGSTFGQIDEV